ncbi:MAG: hypothetical protein M1296_05425 [Chloroflexi bacterium]|nr:hypothetical protein [Chloroflexota bacterium]
MNRVRPYPDSLGEGAGAGEHDSGFWPHEPEGQGEEGQQQLVVALAGVEWLQKGSPYALARNIVISVLWIVERRVDQRVRIELRQRQEDALGAAWLKLGLSSSK